MDTLCAYLYENRNWNAASAGWVFNGKLFAIESAGSNS